AGLVDPVGQAVAAEARQAHQIDVSRIVAVAQMAHQAAERGGGHRIGQGIERVGGGIAGTGCRIRPASRAPEMLEKSFRAGADAFRVNMSHGDHATHAETIASIRASEKKVNRPITISCDLQGPKSRVG
ncbi:hypothetical protein OY671_010246, partial [Metschnikowia pulcherrima]